MKNQYLKDNEHIGWICALFISFIWFIAILQASDSQRMNQICSLKPSMQEAMENHQAWIDHPEWYSDGSQGMKEKTLEENMNWDRRWIEVYKSFLDDCS